MVLDLETIMEKTCADVLEYMHVYYVLEASSEKNNDHIPWIFFPVNAGREMGHQANHENIEPWKTTKTHEM